MDLLFFLQAAGQAVEEGGAVEVGAEASAVLVVVVLVAEAQEEVGNSRLHIKPF